MPEDYLDYSEFVVDYQVNGETGRETFPVYDGISEEKAIKAILEFGKTHNILTVFSDPDHTYFHPKTMEIIDEPNYGNGIHYYELQEWMPFSRYQFTAIDPDELPF